MRSRVLESLAMGLCLFVAGCGGGGDGGAPALSATVAVSTNALEAAQVAVEPSAQRQDTIDKGALAADPPLTSINKPFKLPGTVVDVSVGSVTPAVIDTALYEGSVMPDVLLFGSATGNLAVLSGKTLYVYIEDPVGFFQSSAQAYPTNSPSAGLTVWLRGALQTKPGAYRGYLTINVCLDVGCNARVREIHVPYRVDVLRGYRAAGQATQDPYPTQPLALRGQSAFGEVVAAARMVLVPPERAPVSSLYANWFPTRNEWEDSKVGNEPIASFIDNMDGTVTFNVELPPQMTPGTRTGTFYLFTSYAQQPTYTKPPSFTIAFGSVVVPNAAVPVAFSPTSLALSVPANSTTRPTATIRVAAGDPEAVIAYEAVEPTMDAERLSLLPPEAWTSSTGVISPSNIGGWTGSPIQYVFPAGCAIWAIPGGGTGSACLPPGTYDFRLRYRHTLRGVVSFVYFPVKLTITP